MCVDARAGALEVEVPASFEGLEPCVVPASHGVTRTALGGAFAAASAIEHMAGEEGDVLGAREIDDAFACVAWTAVVLPVWEELGCAACALAEVICAAAVDACAKSAAGQGVDLTVAA